MVRRPARLEQRAAQGSRPARRLTAVRLGDGARYRQPLPPLSRERERDCSPRWNASHTCSTSSGAMPGTSSSTCKVQG